MKKRPSWDEIFMFQAISCATRHSCLKRPVGAALVKDKRIIGTGYNGAACGIKNCLELGYCYYEHLAYDEWNKNGKSKKNTEFKNLRENFKIYCLAVHAEANALSQCSRDEAKDSTLYITNYPCPRCVQDVIITNQIKVVKIWKEYLSNPLLTIDEKRASEHKFIEAGTAVSYIDLSKDRITKIASYMANQVGERTDYKYSKPS